jgi:pimeloyl-ACP methyl ester carboxylesterase
MGATSRPDNYDASKFTPEQSIDYFVNYLENLRNEMNLTDFYLAGHSFGGYMVGNYANMYSQHLRKVIMLSPIGVINKFNPEDKNDELV